MSDSIQIGAWTAQKPHQRMAEWTTAEVRQLATYLQDYGRLGTEPMLAAYVCDVIRAFGARLEVGESWPDNWKQKENAK